MLSIIFFSIELLISSQPLLALLVMFFTMVNISDLFVGDINKLFALYIIGLLKSWTEVSDG